MYEKYKRKFFPKLLQDPKVSPEDKVKIKELLKKPWNPYIRRHSALTEKSQILKETCIKAICWLVYRFKHAFKISTLLWQ